MEVEEFSSLPTDESIPQTSFEGRKEASVKWENAGRLRTWIALVCLLAIATVAALLLWGAYLQRNEAELQQMIEKATSNSPLKAQSQPDQKYASTLKDLVQSSQQASSRLEQLEKKEQEIQQKIEHVELTIKLQQQRVRARQQNPQKSKSQEEKHEIDQQELATIMEQISRTRAKIKTPIEKAPKKGEDATEGSEPLYEESALAEKAKYEKEKLAYIESKRWDFAGVELSGSNFDLSDDGSYENLLQFVSAGITPDLEGEGKTPFCVIVASYLPHPLYVLEHSLNSIFRQQYGPMLAVLFSSPAEETNQFIRDYLRINAVPAERYRLEQAGGEPALLNVATAIQKHCPAGSMAMVVEGGNELLGKYVLQIYNEHVQIKGLSVVFSNHYQFKLNGPIRYGRTAGPNDHELRSGNFRKEQRTQFQLLAFSTDLFKKIKPEDFKDKSGNFFKAPLTAIALPLLELSCGRARKIGGMYYLQNLSQQFQSKMQAESEAFRELSSRSPYACDAAFNRSVVVRQPAPTTIPPELQAISSALHRQQPGMVDTPEGHVSLIDLNFQNAQGQRIADIVYPYSYLRKARVLRHKRKIDYINRNKGRKSLQLAKYNLKFDDSLEAEQKLDEEAEYERLNAVYHFEKYKQELPICVIVPTVNNHAESRFQYSLNAIFTQNYTNYFAVIINDASTDVSDLTYRQYLHFYGIPPQRYAYIHNQVRKTAMTNIYEAELNYCSEDSITVVADGDDEIMGKNVFKTLNAAYQRLRGGVIYSNFYSFTTDRRLDSGSSRQYSKKTKEDSAFRKENARYSHLRSHRTALFLGIDKSNFQDSSGNFYRISCDAAMFFPLMERACGRVYYLNEYFYLYNTNTGMNDNVLDYHGQEAVVLEVKRKPKLECAPEYKDVPFVDLST